MVFCFIDYWLVFVGLDDIYVYLLNIRSNIYIDKNKFLLFIII